MKRRQFMGYAGASLATVLATTALPKTRARSQSSPLQIQWLGHTCFLFSGDGLRILVNPFDTLGCTAGYPAPLVEADLVLISSQLLDEGGAVGRLPGSPQVLFEPGVYRFGGKQIQGISVPHDRQNGRRFGQNVIWFWQQAGVRVLHLGGAAAPIEIEQRILIGRPDIAFIPVGGGPKAYNPQEARQAMDALNPRLVVPTHYRTAAADEQTCDIEPLDEFIQLVQEVPVEIVGSTIALTPGAIPQQGPAIRVFSLS